MSIRYECEHCGSVLKIKDDLAGKPGKCPKCKTAFTVPAPSGEDSSGEIAVGATETSEDAEAILAGSQSSGATDDFDVDAFLSEDDESGTATKSKPKTAKASREMKALAEDASLDDLVPKSKGKSAKSTVAEDDDDTFQIRRGPDAPGKSNSTRLPESDDEELDESPMPSRRPPGTNPNAGAANIASDLLSKSAKKGKKTSWDEAEADPKKAEEGFDWSGLWYEVRTKLLPVAGGGAVVFLLLYFFVFPAFGTKFYTPPLGRVTGTVTVNGKPLTGAVVWFHPDHSTEEFKGKKFKVTSSSAMTDPQGHYELMYNTDAHGAIIGNARVQIVTTILDGIALQYLGDKATATREVHAGKQVIDLELSK